MKRWIVAFLLMCAVSAACPQTGAAENIAVISRKDIIPYETFREGYYEAFGKKKAGHRVKTFYLSSGEGGSTEDVIQKLTSFRPGALMCIGTGALEFAGAYFPDIPKVYAMVIDPPAQRQGHARTLGVDMRVPFREKLELLREFKSDAKAIGAVYDPAATEEEVQKAEEAARALGLTFSAVALSSPKEAISAIDGLMDHIDAYLLLLDRTLLSPHVVEHLLTESFRRNVPVIGPSEKYVRMGALFSVDHELEGLADAAWQYTLVCLDRQEACSGLKTVKGAEKIFINGKIAEKLNVVIPGRLLDDPRVVIKQ